VNTQKLGVLANLTGVSYKLFNINNNIISIVKITAEIKKDRFMANVGPSSYEKPLTDKKQEPKWSMGAKI